MPAAPTLSVSGLTDTASPAQQPAFDVQLSSTYPLSITGTVTLSFAPNAANAADDPAIQFSGGGRTLNFTIAAGQTRAFPTTLPSIQTGTVAGHINLSLENLTAAGQNITPVPAPVRSITIARAAPKIDTVQVVQGHWRVQHPGEGLLDTAAGHAGRFHLHSRKRRQLADHPGDRPRGQHFHHLVHGDLLAPVRQRVSLYAALHGAGQRERHCFGVGDANERDGNFSGGERKLLENREPPGLPARGAEAARAALVEFKSPSSHSISS